MLIRTIFLAVDILDIIIVVGFGCITNASIGGVMIDIINIMESIMYHDDIMKEDEFDNDVFIVLLLL